MLDQNEIELFRDNVKKFLENEVAPHYDQWEKAEMFPRELWNKLGESCTWATKSRSKPGCRKW